MGVQVTGLEARPSVGAASRPIRFLIVALVVAVYTALGLVLRPNLAEYQLMGIPLLLAFQLGIHRQPVRTLWVRSGPPVRIDVWFGSLWVLFSLVPGYEALQALGRLDLSAAGLYATGIAGAFGLTYALRSMRSVQVRQMGLCLLTAGGIALLPELLLIVLPGLLHVHLHIAGGSASAGHPVTLGTIETGAVTFLWGFPAGFMIEEVFFRGALDTYLHRGEKGTGWLSAIFVSALWGIWHLPGSAQAGPHLLSTVAGLLAAQIVVGVPLSLWWRKSGNLAVNNTTHAVIDAVRSVLAAVG